VPIEEEEEEEEDIKYSVHAGKYHQHHMKCTDLHNLTRGKYRKCLNHRH
jgi:hypothetical protein